MKKTSPSGNVVYFGDDVEISSCQMKKYIPFAAGPTAQKTGNQIEWLEADHLGSVFSITNSFGDVTWSKRYRPYGEELLASGSTSENSRGYTGQRTDDETGLIYLHARYYDPIIGRFISPDPIISFQHPAGLNPYNYAFNNPVSNSDVSGMAVGWSNFIDDAFKNISAYFSGVRPDEMQRVELSAKATLGAGGAKIKLIDFTPGFNITRDGQLGSFSMGGEVGVSGKVKQGRLSVGHNESKDLDGNFSSSDLLGLNLPGRLRAEWKVDPTNHTMVFGLGLELRDPKKIFNVGLGANFAFTSTPWDGPTFSGDIRNANISRMVAEYYFGDRQSALKELGQYKNSETRPYFDQAQRHLNLLSTDPMKRLNATIELNRK